MKKLFISCPMKGRTEENIRDSMARMHKIAEAYFGQELEVIPTYIEDNPPENAKQAVWFLGESIKLMAEADFFIGVGYSDCFSGCTIEHEVACSYGIPHYRVDLGMMPDAMAIEQLYFDNKRKCEA